MLLALLSLHPAAAARAQQLHDCKAGETYSSVKALSDSSARALASNAKALAARYAPTISFVGQEEFFPTMPFARAFDGISNDGDNDRDFADLDELTFEGTTRNISLNKLIDNYRANPWAAGQQYVFYRVRCTNGAETDLVRRFLKKDPQAWQHRHYKISPTILLKDHLYRPAEFYGFDLLTWGVNFLPTEHVAPYIGVVVPVPYIPIHLSGVLEFNAGVAMRPEHRSTFFISGTYDSSYRDLLGFFSRVSYTAGTRDRLGIAAPDVSLSLGPSILLWSSDRRNTYLPTRITNAIRIRVGPRIYLRTFDDLLSRATTEVSVGFRQ